jgi:hypothetical protein
MVAGTVVGARLWAGRRVAVLDPGRALVLSETMVDIRTAAPARRSDAVAGAYACRLQIDSAEARTVTARVVAYLASGTRSSPGKRVLASSAVAPQRNSQGRTANV